MTPQSIFFRLFPGLVTTEKPNVRCMSFITVFGQRSSYDGESLRQLERRFIQCLFEVLKIDNPSQVDVCFVSGGSIMFCFIMSLQHTSQLQELWKEQPSALQNAFRGLGSTKTSPVISVKSTAGIKEISEISVLAKFGDCCELIYSVKVISLSENITWTRKESPHASHLEYPCSRCAINDEPVHVPAYLFTSVSFCISYKAWGQCDSCRGPASAHVLPWPRKSFQRKYSWRAGTLFDHVRPCDIDFDWIINTTRAASARRLDDPIKVDITWFTHDQTVYPHLMNIFAGIIFFGQGVVKIECFVFTSMCMT